MTNTNATPQSDVLVFLGDSLTEHGRWADWFPDHDVVNAGRSGDTTTDVHGRIAEVVDAGPSTVLVLAGTNDINQRATVEQVVRGIENILHDLRRDLPSARLIVESVLPRERERAEWIRQVNIHVRQFAPTVKAEYLDLWPTFAEDDGEIRPQYSADRLHLNDEGYAAWVDAIRTACAI